jgi:hypothetical protein
LTLPPGGGRTVTLMARTVTAKGATGAGPGEHQFKETGCLPLRPLWGWSPPSLPARTRWERRVDRYLLSSGWPCLAYIVAIVGLLSLAPHLAARGGLGLDAAAFLAAGGWCALNFWRCRHAHCVLTGAGWLAQGTLALVETGFGHSVIAGYEQPVFLGVLVAGLGFEAAWAPWRRTNRIGPSLGSRSWLWPWSWCERGTGRANRTLWAREATVAGHPSGAARWPRQERDR